MKPKPTKKYREPRYPTRLRVHADPRILARNLPPAWRKAEQLAGAAAILLATGAAAGPSGKSDARTPAQAIVAPIFNHGGGVGGTGCIVTAPPVFLSEEEGRLLIREELAKQGLKFGVKDLDLADVSMQVCQIKYYRDGKEVDADTYFRSMAQSLDRAPKDSPHFEMKASEPVLPFQLDALDLNKKVGFEFVSEQDYDLMKPLLLGGCLEDSTAHGVATKGLAQALSGPLGKAKADMRLGLFYDPVNYPETPKEDNEAALAWCDRKPKQDQRQECKRAVVEERVRKSTEQTEEELVQQAKEQSKAQLRLQVQDFVQWLKAQGAI